MTDKNKEAREQMARADQAKLLLENPLYIEAMDKIEIALFGAFCDTKLEDESLRHELWQKVKIKRLFQAQFEHIVTTGSYASDTLKLNEHEQNQYVNSDNSE